MPFRGNPAPGLNMSVKGYDLELNCLAIAMPFVALRRSPFPGARRLPAAVLGP
jgi:hypothetical protein